MPDEDSYPGHEERTERLARAAISEARRAMKSLCNRANDPGAIEDALAALNLTRSLAPDDPLVEALAVQLLWNAKTYLLRDRSVRTAATAGPAGG